MSNILGQSVECDSEIIVEALRERKETAGAEGCSADGLGEIAFFRGGFD
jgi:hypothetical protein